MGRISAFRDMMAMTMPMAPQIRPLGKQQQAQSTPTMPATMEQMARRSEESPGWEFFGCFWSEAIYLF